MDLTLAYGLGLMKTNPDKELESEARRWGGADGETDEVVFHFVNADQANGHAGAKLSLLFSLENSD